MKTILSMLFLLHLNVTFSQNLVTNPSFEDYSTCPTISNQLSFAFPWVNPTSSGTPDFYHGCSSTFGIPSYCNCPYAYQYANSGIGYSGIGCFGASTSNGREYIQTQLNSTLVINNCYFVEFYVNLQNGVKYACNKLSLNFSDTQPSLISSSSLLNLTSHISDFQNRIVIDTLNWKPIKGIYFANGSENFITIGIFNTDSQIDTLTVNSNSIADGAYYYIDDVSVIEIGNLPGGMPAFAGNDVTISQFGDSAFIGQEISNLNCNWSVLGSSQIATNTSGLFVQPTSTTTYVVEQTLCGTITYDTVTVFVTVGIEELNNDSIFEIYPNPTTGKEVFNSILSISNGVTDFDLKVESGTYIVTITNTNTYEKVIRKISIQK